MKSKLLLSLLVVIGAVGCASNDVVKPTVYKLQNYVGPEAMQPNEVVQASKQCHFAKMKPPLPRSKVSGFCGQTVLVT